MFALGKSTCSYSISICLENIMICYNMIVSTKFS